MFYELRQYEAHTSRMNDLIDRFANVNAKLFERHGFRAVGYWREDVGIPHRLIYLLAWESWEAREKGVGGVLCRSRMAEVKGEPTARRRRTSRITSWIRCRFRRCRK